MASPYSNKYAAYASPAYASYDRLNDEDKLCCSCGEGACGLIYLTLLFPPIIPFTWPTLCYDRDDEVLHGNKNCFTFCRW